MTRADPNYYPINILRPRPIHRPQIDVIESRGDSINRAAGTRAYRIARLAAGDSLALPQELVGFLDQLRALGVDERIVQVERDGWIPLVARSPERVPGWITRKRKQIADPQRIDFS
ncbi:hypothetical protein ACFTS5_06495 [Nocardia sp. NPDC056952]|uniref:hypothetical protein n=1 Tax=Nocardia sp. NPDC056952 TaxID=3345979 RepID=UPI003625D44E